MNKFKKDIYQRIYTLINEFLNKYENESFLYYRQTNVDLLYAKIVSYLDSIYLYNLSNKEENEYDTTFFNLINVQLDILAAMEKESFVHYNHKPVTNNLKDIKSEIYYEINSWIFIANKV